jgi:hypothetical protein
MFITQGQGAILAVLIEDERSAIPAERLSVTLVCLNRAKEGSEPGWVGQAVVTLEPKSSFLAEPTHTPGDQAFGFYSSNS